MHFKEVKITTISVILLVAFIGMNACSDIKDVIDDSQQKETSEESTIQTDITEENSYAEGLILFDDWKTNWLKKSIDLSELTTTGSTRDGISPIDDPVFEPVSHSNAWIMDKEPILVLVYKDTVMGFPLKIMIRHEVVNETVNGTPIAVTFCPLTNSAAAFNREVNGQIYEFGTSGLVRKSNFIMWDRQTQTLWQQLTGKAIVGDLNDTKLTRIPIILISWEDFKNNYPDGSILSKKIDSSIDYDQTPYVEYDDKNSLPFLFHGTLDSRLPAMERIVGIQINDESIAFPFSLLSEIGVVNYSIGEKEITVLFSPSTISVMDNRIINESKDIGTATAFYRIVDDKIFSFMKSKESIIDAETGSTWSLTGTAISGPMQGAQLQIVEHSIYFWFAWASFYPQTLIYEVQENNKQ